jgi:hypothetical protein
VTQWAVHLHLMALWQQWMALRQQTWLKVWMQLIQLLTLLMLRRLMPLLMTHPLMTWSN